MGLPEIALELDALVADVASMRDRVDRCGAGSVALPPHVQWDAARAAAQVDALNLRLDALVAEVHRFEARTHRRSRIAG